LEINIRDDSKIVEIWLTNAEKRDNALRESLKPLYQKYAKQKYLVAVFQSGERDLCDATSDLLCYNRKRLAEQEAQRQRQQGMTMEM
jgi:hypothetical protein